MAGARNAAAAALDTTIGTLITQYNTYAAVVATGEPPNATADYFLNSLFNRLLGVTDLKQKTRQFMFAAPHFRPANKRDFASPTLVLLDPKASA